MPGKGQEGRRDRHLEEAGGEVFAGVEHFGEEGGQQRVGDQRSGDADAFVVAHKVRACGDVDGEALRFQHGAQIGAGRTFAVGACNVEHRW